MPAGITADSFSVKFTGDASKLVAEYSVKRELRKIEEVQMKIAITHQLMETRQSRHFVDVQHNIYN